MFYKEDDNLNYEEINRFRKMSQKEREQLIEALELELLLEIDESNNKTEFNE